MIARPKMSQIEWKTIEIRASKVGNFSPFSCPGDDNGDVVNFLGVQIEISERVAMGILQNMDSKSPAGAAAGAAANAKSPDSAASSAAAAATAGADAAAGDGDAPPAVGAKRPRDS